MNKFVFMISEMKTLVNPKKRISIMNNQIKQQIHAKQN